MLQLSLFEILAARPAAPVAVAALAAPAPVPALAAPVPAPARPAVDPSVVAAILARRSAAAPAPARRRSAPPVAAPVDFDPAPDFDAGEDAVSVLCSAGLAAAARVARCGSLAD